MGAIISALHANQIIGWFPNIHQAMAEVVPLSTEH
jgi:hypothetical protein